MNVKLCGIGALAIYVGGSILFSEAQVVPGFPKYALTPDADPGTRHRVEVSMPTRLNVQRTSSRFSVSYDLASLRRVTITVGKKMTIGVKDELRVYPQSDARPSQYSSLFEGTMNEKEPAIPLSNPNLLT